MSTIEPHEHEERIVWNTILAILPDAIMSMNEESGTLMVDTNPERYVVVCHGKDSDGEMVTAGATTSPGVFDRCHAGQKWTGTECISQ